MSIPSITPPPSGRSTGQRTRTYLTDRLNGVPARTFPGRVRDAHFGHPTRAELQDLHAELGAAVRADILAGAPVHRRLPMPIRQVPWVVAVLDWIVLLTFSADVFNLVLTDGMQHPLRAVAAVMLALLGSGIGYTWLAMTGIRLRAYRTELGEIAWRATGVTTWVMISVAAVLIGALTALMYLRVATEIVSHTSASVAALAGVLATLFAVLSAVANMSVVAVHALDGSCAMAELERAGRLLHRYEQLPDAGAAPIEDEVAAALPRPRA